VAVITGMRQVMRTLSALEDGRISEPDAIELYACEGGCFGSALLGEACATLTERAFWSDPRSRDLASPPLVPLARRSPRRGYRLDDDMARAMNKLAAIGALRDRLPGRDCGHCGAPGCAAFAEDVVLARAAEKACPYRIQGAP
jgi:hypothetical protein